MGGGFRFCPEAGPLGEKLKVIAGEENLKIS